MIKTLFRSSLFWFFLLILVLSVLIKGIFLKQGHEVHAPKDAAVQKNYNILGDNFAEHLNALTQRLQTVMTDYQALKDSHRQITEALDALKKENREGSALSLSRQMSRLKTEVESLDKKMMSFSEALQKKQDHQVEQSKFSEDIASFEVLEDISLHESPIQEKDALLKPVYTIPSGATLAESVTMSALIGRIPVEGMIHSPYPFKVILGRENLISNGFILPDVQGAIVQGYSIGDMTLSCVRGMVTELTFLFPDGRIVNTKSEINSLEQLNHALGYLSEPDGNPCLSGTFYSNAVSFLSGELALGTLQGAAKGLSLAQQGQRSNPYGSEQYMNGDLSKMLLGSAGEAGISRVQAWWEARQKDSFDVIYVPSGRSVVINITRTISIDDDPFARKLHYE